MVVETLKSIDDSLWESDEQVFILKCVLMGSLVHCFSIVLMIKFF